MNGDEGFARAFPHVARRMADEALVNRFTYHAPTGDLGAVYEIIRAHGLAMARELNAYCPPSDELVNAVNAIDVAVMWANASIARHGGG